MTQGFFAVSSRAGVEDLQCQRLVLGVVGVRRAEIEVGNSSVSVSLSAGSIGRGGACAGLLTEDTDNAASPVATSPLISTAMLL